MEMEFRMEFLMGIGIVKDAYNYYKTHIPIHHRSNAISVMTSKA
jgi:hypothetical protein